MLSDSLIGRQLGDFLIREQVGRGGMATVYRAHQGSVHRDVALKIIPLGNPDSADGTFRIRFEKEAALVASLEHIHILPIFDYGITEDAAYLAMRLLRGGTLSGLLRDAPLPIDTATELFRQFASGLAYAHSKGVIHRDLKPGNIMLDDSGNALLTDFGLAKLIGDTFELTRSGALVGTPSYMSPEQVLGKSLDHRADIYSAGVVLYHMLAGRTPFGGQTSDLIAIVTQQVKAEPPPPSQINPAIPPPVEAVILRALRKDREERYQTIGAMAADLERAVGRRGSSTEGLAPSELRVATPSPSPRPRGGDLEPGRGMDRRDLDFGYGVPEVRGPATHARRRTLRILTMVGAFVVLGLVALRWARRETESPRAHAMATVRTGERAEAAAATPSATEIARARKRLGNTGFIAYIACTQRTEYHATQAREMGDLATRDALPYRVYDSDGDDYRQTTQIERARADGARGLIVCPLNASLLATPLSSARQAGIPLVLMSSDMPSYGGVMIAGDDYEMGLQAGRFAGEIVAREMGGKANVVVLDYPELPYLMRRAEGMQRGLLEKASGARIVGRAKGGTREFAAASVGNLIARGLSFNVLLSINDAGSFGAIAAMERAGIAPGSVLISSVDAEALAREYILKDRFIRGSVATDRERFSGAAIGAMVKLLAGSTVPGTFVVAPGQVVTRAALRVAP